MCKCLFTGLIGLLLLGTVTARAGLSTLALAHELAAEGDWIACRYECRRVELAEPSAAAQARALRERAERELALSRRQAGWWTRVGALPVKAMVGFYRLAVAPALGSRCVMEPSCSHFSMQAAMECGWLGVPMTGDRLIAEASMVVARHQPVTNSFGQVRFADPVSDHIGWRPAGRLDRVH
jgi:putative component of membrane protein insertase Oxa1/YidC/SpoIIIJ protein YidD